MRPGHFWAAELGDADGKGSPILAGPFKERTYWPLCEGEPGWDVKWRGIPRQRYDPGDCALLLRRYFHRTADDPEGLTFVTWKCTGSERLVVNSSELCAVQGRQVCDFKLVAPQARRQVAVPCVSLPRHTKKQAPAAQTDPPAFDYKMRYRLDPEIDQSTRTPCPRVCEAT